MVRNSIIYTKDNSVPLTKRYQKFSYFWWNVCGIYGKCGNGKIKIMKQIILNKLFKVTCITEPLIYFSVIKLL